MNHGYIDYDYDQYLDRDDEGVIMNNNNNNNNNINNNNNNESNNRVVPRTYSSVFMAAGDTYNSDIPRSYSSVFGGGNKTAADSIMATHNDTNDNPNNDSLNNSSTTSTKKERSRSLSSTNHERSTPSPSPPPIHGRSRLDSKDIPRTYSGLYGAGGMMERTKGQTPSSTLLPFELSRNRNTDFLHPRQRGHGRPLLFAYLSCLVVLQVLVMIVIFIMTPLGSILMNASTTNTSHDNNNNKEASLQLGSVSWWSLSTSWTFTNCIHAIISLWFLHWVKGSPEDGAGQGEMNAMTWWEQITSSPEDDDLDDPSLIYNSMNNSEDAGSRPRIRTWSGSDNGSGNTTNEYLGMNASRTVLLVVPTVLCYLACHFGGYERNISSINFTVWIVCMVAKMEFMMGVRVWGINSTTGIDDDQRRPLPIR